MFSNNSSFYILKQQLCKNCLPNVSLFFFIMMALLHNRSRGRRALRITRYYDNCSTLAVTKTKERSETVGNILISGSLITELLIISPHMHKSVALMKWVASCKVAWKGSRGGIKNKLLTGLSLFHFQGTGNTCHRIYLAWLWESVFVKHCPVTLASLLPCALL